MAQAATSSSWWVNRGTDAQAATASEGNELEGMEVLHLVLRQWGSHGEATGLSWGNNGNK